MSRNWRWMIPCYILTLPLTLIALLYAVIWCHGHHWKWQDGCLTFISDKMIGHPGGQCWSPVIGFQNEETRQWTPIQVHERCHVVQTFLFSLGALCIVPWPVVALGFSNWVILPAVSLIGCTSFSLAYVGFFLYYYLKAPTEGWHAAYRLNPFEQEAYEIQAQYILNPNKGDLWGEGL